MIHLIKLMRPHQWTKNLICLAGVVFSGSLFDLKSIFSGLGAVICFCLASSAIYILNDIIDKDIDALHPKKKFRPLPSGKVSMSMAKITGILLIVLPISLGYIIHISLLFVLLLYVFNNIVYSKYLKHLPIFDVLSIAFGFVLRLVSGIYILDIQPTSWIVLCTFFLALFLGISKRNAEFNSRLSTPAIQRPVLAKYNQEFLNVMLNSTALLTIICYSLFTTTLGRNPSLALTVPIVFYAITYYQRLVIDNKSEEPDRILLKNRTIQISIIVWLILYIFILYGEVRILQ